MERYLTAFRHRMGTTQQDCFHRLNTTAGSIRVTLMIAATAEMAHIATVSMKIPSVRIGVMVTGTAMLAVAHTMIRLNAAAIENPMTALKKAWQMMTW